MHPVICHIGPVSIYSFGVMVALAAVVCSVLMGREARRLNIGQEEVYDLVFWAAAGGIIGARLFFIALNFSTFWSDPKEIIMIQNGGLAWQGGLLGGALATGLLTRRKGWDMPVIADLAAPYLALGHAIGRIGCFLNGCCYGKEIAWGIYFPVHGAHLHPTQLYEFALLVILFAVLKGLRASFEKRPGMLFVLYVICASAIRFAVEFFRADHQPLFLQLSIFQYVSIGFFLAGLGLIFYLRKRHG